MWSKKRQRNVFRKRSKRGRILWLFVGTIILVGLVWFIPWQTLSSVGIQDTLKSETSKDQPEQCPVEDQPEQPDTEGQPEQRGTSDQPRNEAALEGTPPKEEGAPNNLPSPSLPPPAQLSPPPQAPSPTSTPGVEEVPRNSLSPNDYWYSEQGYWYPDYWYSEAGYWDYEDDYYWDY